MKPFGLLLVVLAACGNDFGNGKDDDGGGSGAEVPWATHCLKLRSCFGDPRPVSACILVEASGDNTVSPFLRPPRVENGTAQELVQGTAWWELFLSSRRGCIDRAATCDDARHCGNSDGTTCTTEPRCRSGDNLNGCFGEGSDEYTYEIHCTQSDLNCFPNAEGGAACGEGDCLVGPPDPLCDGAALVACEDGVIQRSECSELGKTCGTAAGGALGCRGVGADCADAPLAPVEGDPLYPMAAATCDGTRATYCDNGGLTTIDCSSSAMMRTCTEGAPGGCTPTGEECDPRTFVGECDGTAVQYCVDGNVETIDCSTTGPTSCAVIAGAPGCQ